MFLKEAKRCSNFHDGLVYSLHIKHKKLHVNKFKLDARSDYQYRIINKLHLGEAN